MHLGRLVILLIALSPLMRVFGASEGMLRGKFVINENGDVVSFSKGNLMYEQSTDTWSFAEHQYDVIGAANLVSGTSDLANKIDLFGWSGNSSTSSNYGVSNETGTSFYDGSFLDWGHNSISNGGNETDIWRTLTKAEWTYLMEHNGPFATMVNGVAGIAIMPYNAYLDKKESSYTIEAWTEVEKQGVVFLPHAGYREASSTEVSDVSVAGYYWSGTSNNPLNASAAVSKDKEDKLTVKNTARQQGCAVRLVKNVSNCSVTIKAEPNDASSGTVTIDVVTPK